MADDGEPFVAQLAHEPDHIAGHGAVAVDLVLGVRLGLGGLAITPQVWAHHGVAGRDQQRRDEVPRRMRARVAMDQDHRWAIAAVSDPQGDIVPDGDIVQGEARKDHRLSIPDLDPTRQASGLAGGA